MSYFKDSYSELVNKVTWPTWSELQNSAVVVMITSLIIALLIGLVDFGFKNVMEMLYSFLKGIR